MNVPHTKFRSLLRRADDLILLAILVEEGSYTAASVACGLQKSLISRRILELEAELGVRLIERTTRSFRVTDIGMQLYRHGCAVRDHREAALADVNDRLASPRGPLCVVCPVALAEVLVGRIAISFAANYPDVQLTFDVLNSTPNVLPDHYDLAFLPSYGILPDSDVVTKRVVRTPYELVASPGWLAAAGELRSAKDLQGLAGIGWWQAGANPTWRLFGGRGEQHEIKIRPTLQTNNLFVARDAAIAGLGMARLPKPLSEGEIAAGRLARVLENYRPAPVTIFVAYPSRRSLTAAGRAFLDWLTKDAASYIAAFGDAAN